MPVLLSLISSGAIKWLSILILVLGLVTGLYIQHRKIVNNEKEIALQTYNIDQLSQNVKDNKAYIEQMEAISKHKSEIVAKLYIEKDSLDEKISKLMAQVNDNVVKGHDRESSKVLKDLFKSLGEQK